MHQIEILISRTTSAKYFTTLMYTFEPFCDFLLSKTNKKRTSDENCLFIEIRRQYLIYVGNRSIQNKCEPRQFCTLQYKKKIFTLYLLLFSIEFA